MQKEIIYIDSIKQDEIKLKVAAYIRVSSSSDDQLNSLDTQYCYYEKLLHENSQWQMVDIYCDEGLSALSTTKRDDFNRMIADAKRGRIDRIITKSISRFARNTHDALTTVRALKEIGVSIFFEKENIDTNSLSGEVLLTTFSAFAQEESLSISKNIKHSTRIRMAKGTYVSPSVPYGYRLVDNKLVIEEQEAIIIKRIFNEYLSGKGRYLIARGLTQDNILSATGNSYWSESSVGELLANERFKGDMLLQKSYTPDTFPLRDVKNKGEVPMYYVKNSHEPIIEAEVFDKVQKLLQSKSVKISPTRDKIFRGKIFCGNCNTTYRPTEVKEQHYWVCRKHNKDNSCPVKAIPEIELADAFIRMYNKLKENYEYILSPMLKALIKLSDSRYTTNKGIEQLNKEIALLSEQSHTLNGLINQGVLDSALFISEKDELSQKIRKLKAEKRHLMQEDKDHTINKTEQLIELLKSNPNFLVKFEDEIFDEVIDYIKVYEDRQIGFVLINGIELVEKIKDARR